VIFYSKKTCIMEEYVDCSSIFKHMPYCSEMNNKGKPFNKIIEKFETFCALNRLLKEAYYK
jgi:hypothetical protein